MGFKLARLNFGLKTIVEDKWVLNVLGKALVEGHS